jgi:PIN domain nuclease of toxin-antitoxin system
MDSAPSRLSPIVRDALLDPANQLHLSVASIWEMQIKSQLGKLSLSRPLRQIIADQQSNGVEVLPIEAASIFEIEGLPAIHKDPFDRLIIAQSRIMRARLVTNDPLVQGYPVDWLW